MSHDRRGLTVVEIILLIALIILPLTLVLILFGKDIKRWIGGGYGSARTESERLYKDRSGTGMGSVKGQVGAAGTGSGAESGGGGGTGGGGTGGGGGDSGGGGGHAAAPVQSTSKAPSGGSGGGGSATEQADSGKPANLGLVVIAVCVALVAAFASTTMGRK